MPQMRSLSDLRGCRRAGSSDGIESRSESGRSEIVAVAAQCMLFSALVAIKPQKKPR